MIQWVSTTSLPFELSTSYSYSASAFFLTTDTLFGPSASASFFSSNSNKVESNQWGITTRWASGYTYAADGLATIIGDADTVTQGFVAVTETSSSVTFEDIGATTYTVTSTKSVYSTVSTLVPQATQSTWTTATTEQEFVQTTSSTYSTTNKSLVATFGNEVSAGNAFNTIYEANSFNEAQREDQDVRVNVPNVFYRNQDGQLLEDWAGEGETVSWETRATRSATATLVEPLFFQSSSPLSTFTRESYSSAASWTATATSAGQAPFYIVSALPNSSYMRNAAIVSTVSSSTSVSTASSTREFRGISTTTASAFTATKTTHAFAGPEFPQYPQWFNVSYAPSVTMKTFRTMSSFLEFALETLDASGTIEGGQSAETKAAGGNILFAQGAPELSVNTNDVPVWLLYRTPGVWANGQFGASFNLSQSELGYVSLALVGRNNTSAFGFYGMQYSIMPATNDSYTADFSGLTWRPTTSTSALTDTRSEVTVSSVVEAVGDLPPADYVTSRIRMIDGKIGPHETVVQSVWSGVYRDQNGATVWKSGAAQSYDSEHTVTANYLQPQPWLGPEGGPVYVAERNINSIPDFLPRA